MSTNDSIQDVTPYLHISFSLLTGSTSESRVCVTSSCLSASMFNVDYGYPCHTSSLAIRIVFPLVGVTPTFRRLGLPAIPGKPKKKGSNRGPFSIVLSN